MGRRPFKLSVKMSFLSSIKRASKKLEKKEKERRAIRKAAKKVRKTFKREKKKKKEVVTPKEYKRRMISAYGRAFGERGKALPRAITPSLVSAPRIITGIPHDEESLLRIQREVEKSDLPINEKFKIYGQINEERRRIREAAKPTPTFGQRLTKYLRPRVGAEEIAKAVPDVMTLGLSRRFRELGEAGGAALRERSLEPLRRYGGDWEEKLSRGLLEEKEIRPGVKVAALKPEVILGATSPLSTMRRKAAEQAGKLAKGAAKKLFTKKTGVKPEKVGRFFSGLPEKSKAAKEAGIPRRLFRKALLKPEKVVSEYPSPKRIAEGEDYVKDKALVDKLTKALRKSKRLRGEQEVLYKRARGEKLAKMMKARGEMAGEKGYYRELGALKGELPKAEFESVRKEFTQKNVDELFNMVKRNNELDEWEKISAQTGLYKILGEEGGAVPTRSEIEKLYQVFGSDFTKALLSKRSLFEKLKESGMQLYNLPRSMMAGFGDFSATLMQNLVFAYRRPIKTAANFAKSLKDFANDDFHRAAMLEIRQRPNRDLHKAAEISFTDIGPLMKGREEQFMSSWAERIPGIGRVIKATGRAWSGFLNRMRADVADTLIDSYRNLGGNVRSDRFLKTLGEFVNAGTGRGSLGKLERSAPILAQGFFSARKLAATATLINPAFYVKADPFIRKEALKTMLSFIGGAATITALSKLAGADVSADITSSDFGKIKIGNTRVNLFGPYQQLAVLFGRIYKGYATSTTTGRRMVIGEGYRPLTRTELAGRFLEYKEHPTLSYILGAMRGKNQIGEDFEWDVELMNRFIPMIISDTYDLYREHGGKGLLGVIPAMLGLFTQTYGTEIPVTGETATGKPKIEWENVPGLAESILNKLKGKKPSDIPEEEWPALREKRKRENEFMRRIENMEKGSQEQKEAIQDYITNLSSDEEREKMIGKLSLQGYDVKGIKRSEATIKAYNLYKELKSLPEEDRRSRLEDFAKEHEGDVEEFKKIISLVKKYGKDGKAQEIGLVGKDESWSSLKNEDKARIINDRIEPMESEDRKRFVGELIEKGLLTENTAKELTRIRMEAQQKESEKEQAYLREEERILMAGSRRVNIGAGAAVRNNNPLNIKVGGATRHWINEGLAEVGSEAADGGRFIKFNDPETGLEAAKELLTGKVYSDKTVEEAMRAWSNQGYGAEITDIDPNKKISELTDEEIDKLILAMAWRESKTTIEEDEYRPEIGGTEYAMAPTRTPTPSVPRTPNRFLAAIAKEKKKKTEQPIKEMFRRPLPPTRMSEHLERQRLMEFLKRKSPYERYYV